MSAKHIPQPYIETDAAEKAKRDASERLSEEQAPPHQELDHADDAMLRRLEATRVACVRWLAQVRR